jgi:hypothetical protein
MSKRINTDLNSIGNIYGDMLNNVRTIEEKVNEIGEAPLQAGGPLERGGFTKKAVDRRTLSDKEKKDNLYNINNFSEEDEEGEKEHCKHAEEGCDCDECAECEANQKKSLKESRKIVKRSLNNFMSKKSVFEKLYENVMGNNFSSPDVSEDNEELNDMNALGLANADTDDESGDEVEDQVTFTLDRETAQKLIDVMQAALGDGDMEEDMGDEDGMEDMGDEEDYEPTGTRRPTGEEDEEVLGGATQFNTSYNDGKNNKVGSLKTQKGTVVSKTTDKVGNDGDMGHAGVNATYRDGKSNKVGSLKTGKSMFEQ